MLTQVLQSHVRNREVLAVPESRGTLFVSVTRSDLARRGGLREVGWGGCWCISDRLGAWVLDGLDAGPEFPTSEGFPAGGERTLFRKVPSLCLLFQALSTLEDWFGSAWPKRSGTPGPSCLDSTEGCPSSSKKRQLISPAQMKLVFRMVTVLFLLPRPLPWLIRLQTYSL